MRMYCWLASSLVGLDVLLFNLFAELELHCNEDCIMNRRQRTKVNYVALAQGRFERLDELPDSSTKSESGNLDVSDEAADSSLSQLSLSKFPIFVEEDVAEEADLKSNLESGEEKVAITEENQSSDPVSGETMMEDQTSVGGDNKAKKQKTKRERDSGKDTWVCDRCDRVLSNHVGGIRAHQMSCYPIPPGGLPYSCGVCSDRFGSLGLLERHFHLKHPNSSIRFPCVFCERSFSKCHLLRDHAFNQHCIVWLLDIPFELDVHCRGCNSQFDSTNALAAHLQSQDVMARCDPFVRIVGLPVGRTMDIDTVSAHAAEVSLQAARRLPGRARYEAVQLPTSKEGAKSTKISVRIVDELETGDKRAVPVVLRAYSSAGATPVRKRKGKVNANPVTKSKLKGAKKPKMTVETSATDKTPEQQKLSKKPRSSSKLSTPERLKRQLQSKLNRINAGVAALRCEYCRTMFDSKEQVQRHIQLHHKAEVATKKEEVEDSASKATDSTTKKVKKSGVRPERQVRPSMSALSETSKARKGARKDRSAKNMPVVVIKASERAAADAAAKVMLEKRTWKRKAVERSEEKTWHTIVKDDSEHLEWASTLGAPNFDDDTSSGDGIIHDIDQLSDDDPTTTVVEVLRPQSSFMNTSSTNDMDDADFGTSSAPESSLLVPPPDTGLYLSVEQGQRRTEIQFVMNDDDFEDNVNSMVVTQHDMSTSADWGLFKDDEISPDTSQVAQEDDAPLSDMARTLEELPPAPRPSRARGRGRRGGIMKTGMWTESRPLIIPPARRKKPPVVRGPRGRPRGSCSNQSMRGRTLTAPSLQTKTVPALACEECVRIFSSTSSLEAHVRARHAPFRAPPADYPPLPPVPSLPPARLRAALSAGPRAAGVSSRGRRGGSHSGLTRQMLQHMIANGQHKGQQDDEQEQQPQYCQPCDRHFPNHSAYAAHCRVRHSRQQIEPSSMPQQQQQQSQCPLCKLPFTRRLDRDRHVQMKHADHVGFECLRCGQHFELIYQLNAHLRRQHNLAPEGNFELLGPAAEQQQQQQQLDGGDVATDSSATNNTSMNTTIASRVVVTGSEPYLCTICGVGFGRPEPLASHYLAVHVNGLPVAPPLPLPHKCDACEEGFALESQRDEHVRLEHNSDGAFDCGICDCAFASFLSLRQHQQRKHQLFADVVSPRRTAFKVNPLCTLWMELQHTECFPHFSHIGILMCNSRVAAGNSLAK